MNPRPTTPAAAAFFLLFAACATPNAMTAGPTVQGAEGLVKTAEGANGNTNVKILIRHLAPPERIASGATVYVAWIHPTEGLPQNAGQIRLDKNREGRLDAVTPFRAFRVSVTPEPHSTASTPTGTPVLFARVGAD